MKVCNKLKLIHFSIAISLLVGNVAYAENCSIKLIQNNDPKAAIYIANQALATEGTINLPAAIRMHRILNRLHAMRAEYTQSIQQIQEPSRSKHYLETSLKSFNSLNLSSK